MAEKILGVDVVGPNESVKKWAREQFDTSMEQLREVTSNEALAKKLSGFDKITSLKEVILVQLALVKLGYQPGTVDGIYRNGASKTSKTIAAVEKFQEDRNLKKDGQIGPETLAALIDALSAAGDARPAAAPSETAAGTTAPAATPNQDEAGDATPAATSNAGESEEEVDTGAAAPEETSADTKTVAARESLEKILPGGTEALASLKDRGIVIKDNTITIDAGRHVFRNGAAVTEREFTFGEDVVGIDSVTWRGAGTITDIELTKKDGSVDFFRVSTDANIFPTGNPGQHDTDITETISVDGAPVKAGDVFTMTLSDGTTVSGRLEARRVETKDSAGNLVVSEEYSLPHAEKAPGRPIGMVPVDDLSRLKRATPVPPAPAAAPAPAAQPAPAEPAGSEAPAEPVAPNEEARSKLPASASLEQLDAVVADVRVRRDAGKKYGLPSDSDQNTVLDAIDQLMKRGENAKVMELITMSRQIIAKAGIERDKIYGRFGRELTRLEASATPTAPEEAPTGQTLKF